MGKTFEEWWAKLCLKYIEFGGGTEILHICTSMEQYTEDYLHRKVRVPPKIYVSEQVANRYGKATAVYVKEDNG